MRITFQLRQNNHTPVRSQLQILFIDDLHLATRTSNRNYCALNSVNKNHQPWTIFISLLVQPPSIKSNFDFNYL